MRALIEKAPCLLLKKEDYVWLVEPRQKSEVATQQSVERRGQSQFNTQTGQFVSPRHELNLFVNSLII